MIVVAEAEAAPVVLGVALGAALDLSELMLLLGFDGSKLMLFEESLGEAAGGGLELGGLEDDGDDCAIAAETIKPLSAVVIKSFFSIGRTSMQTSVVVECGDGTQARFSVRGSSENRPLLNNV